MSALEKNLLDAATVGVHRMMLLSVMNNDLSRSHEVLTRSIDQLKQEILCLKNFISQSEGENASLKGRLAEQSQKASAFESAYNTLNLALSEERERRERAEAELSMMRSRQPSIPAVAPSSSIGEIQRLTLEEFYLLSLSDKYVLPLNRVPTAIIGQLNLEKVDCQHIYMNICNNLTVPLTVSDSNTLINCLVEKFIDQVQLGHVLNNMTKPGLIINLRTVLKFPMLTDYVLSKLTPSLNKI